MEVAKVNDAKSAVARVQEMDLSNVKSLTQSVKTSKSSKKVATESVIESENSIKCVKSSSSQSQSSFEVEETIEYDTEEEIEES